MPRVVERAGKAVAHCELRTIGFLDDRQRSHPYSTRARLCQQRGLAQLDPFDIETSPPLLSISIGFGSASRQRLARSLIEMVLMRRSMKVCRRYGWPPMI
jgi:hypothetical protein